MSAQQPARTSDTGGRVKVERFDQLPVHSYPIGGTALAVLRDDEQFAALAQRVAADLRADLDRYDIRDRATLKHYFRTLADVALWRGDYQLAAAYQDSTRAVEGKRNMRLATGITERALAAAARGPGEPLDTAAFRSAFQRELAALPYGDVQDTLAGMSSRARRFTSLTVPQFVNNQIEAIARGGSLPLEQARSLIAMRVLLDRIMPVRVALIGELESFLAAHQGARSDIWLARDVTLDGRTDLTPVTIAIWDSGVDVDVYPGQLFTNPHEIPGNDKDDDGNGYVDDVHGVAHDIDRGHVTGVLRPISPAPADSGMPRRLAGPEQMTYSHGTHVAGIAVAGNPAARILVARIERHGMGGDNDYEVPPQPPTVARAHAMAQVFHETIEYFRQHGVRVVNMSWGLHPTAYERKLAANDVGTPEERRSLARQIFDIVRTGLHDAMAAAPDMLFVASAGNYDADVVFDETLPASLDLPNLVSVGAANAAGDETTFTSYGKVDVYANGYQVPSRVVGGAIVRMSGTSMAAPQVVNLAAKLLAVRPRLTVAELRRAIVETADEKTTGADRRLRLLNPRAALGRVLQH